MKKLETLLAQLAEARKASAETREAQRRMLEVVKNMPEYQRADETINETNTLITQLESEIRSLTLMLYDEGETLPEQVAVKWFTVVTQYDSQAARDWCFNNFRPALKLDNKMFEDAVKKNLVPHDLAISTKEARVQIATKLNFCEEKLHEEK